LNSQHTPAQLICDQKSVKNQVKARIYGVYAGFLPAFQKQTGINAVAVHSVFRVQDFWRRLLRQKSFNFIKKGW